MSDTPRTDTEAFDVGCDGRDRHPFGACCESQFARQLETELNAANARIADLEDTITILNQQITLRDDHINTLNQQLDSIPST